MVAKASPIGAGAFLSPISGVEATVCFLDGYSSGVNLSEHIPSGNGYASSSVERIVERRLELQEKMNMIECAAKDAAIDLWPYLLRGVTEGMGYDRLDVPCCKDVYYGPKGTIFWR